MRRARVPRGPRPWIPLVALFAGCGDIASPGAFTPPSGGNRGVFSFVAASLGGGGIDWALVNAGSALCWGRGTLGDGRTTDSDVPVRVSGAHFFTDLSVGTSHACGVSSNGGGVCWGANIRGALGNGEQVASSLPVLVLGGLRFQAIRAGGHTCGVTVGGTGYCWGQNGQGQLGIASSDSFSPVPAPVAGGLVLRDIGVGSGNSCGLTTDGAAYCWGRDWGPTPQPVPTELRFESFSMSRFSTCALTGEGEAFCWGENIGGQFGNGDRDDPEAAPAPYHQEPVRVVTDLRFSAIDTDLHTCAITLDGQSIYCWGQDLSGEVGDGTPTSGEDEAYKLFPTRVRLSRQFASVSVGLGTSCAVTVGNELYCWGLRTGSGSRPTSDVPIRIGG